jgi:hypothetical protein
VCCWLHVVTNRCCVLVGMDGANRFMVGHKVCPLRRWLVLLAFILDYKGQAGTALEFLESQICLALLPVNFSQKSKSCPAVRAFFWLSVPLYCSSSTAANSATWSVLTFGYSATCQERVYVSFHCRNQRPSLPSTSSTCWSCENAACSVRAMDWFEVPC